MNAGSTFGGRKQLVWPAAGVILGAIVSTNPFHAGRIPLSLGIVAWCVAMALVLAVPAHPIGSRIGAVLGGLLWAVPCFVQASPMSRFLLMCCMAMPVAISAALVLAPPIAGFRARLGYLCSWGGTHLVTRRPRSLDFPALRNLLVSTALLAAAIAVVKAASAHDLGFPTRWLAGAVAVGAFAEMVTAGPLLVAASFGLVLPPLMRSPWRSASVAEFWGRRWNVFASEKFFRPWCFAPFARRNPVLALVTAFALSGIGHALLAYMALGRWRISLICGAFFFVQPLLIGLERWIRVRRWRPVLARIWTLSIMALASPLFVEPVLQFVEPSWGAPDVLLLPTLAMLASVLAFSALVSWASLPALTSTP